jgi:hypothetical protein
LRIATIPRFPGVECGIRQTHYAYAYNHGNRQKFHIVVSRQRRGALAQQVGAALGAYSSVLFFAGPEGSVLMRCE